MSELACKYQDCRKSAHAKGYCGAHYQQIRLGKGLSPVIRAPYGPNATLAEAFGAYAHPQAGCWKWSGRLSSEGYARMQHGGKPFYAHRVSYEIHIGPIPSDMFIDHMCHNRACVNPEHLQTVTNKQNLENVSGLRADNTSGVRGVSWNKDRRKFEAYVTHWGERIRLGCFKTLTEAEDVVTAKRNELFTNNLADRRGAL